MAKTLTLSRKWQTVLIDITVLMLVYFIPAFVHATAFPLYYFEPMRLLLFGAYLLSRDHKNAYLLALTLPLVSTIFPPHHPPFYKAVIMSVELFANIACFHWLSGKLKWQAGILIFISTVASKIIYYGLKFLFIKLALIDGALVTTSLWLQLGTLTVLSVLFALFFKRSGK